VSGRAKAPAATDAETARALIRELHEATKDARAALREINEAVSDWAAQGAAMQKTAADSVNLLYEHVASEFRNMREATDDAARVIAVAHAEALGVSTPTEVVSLIAKQVGETLMPTVEKIVRDEMPVAVMETMVDMAENGLDGKLSSQATKVIATAYHGATGTYLQGHNGPSGTVPGRQGHQS
jgi:hypothetical protein